MLFFFSSRRRHTRFDCDWSSDVCSSDLDAFGDGLSNAKGITDGQHRVSDFGLRRVSDGDGEQVAGLNFENGYICLGVSANNPALQFPLVGKCDAHIRGAIDDVIVGEDVASRADDNAGAQALLAMIARLWQSKAS